MHGEVADTCVDICRHEHARRTVLTTTVVSTQAEYGVPRDLGLGAWPLTLGLGAVPSHGLG